MHRVDLDLCNFFSDGSLHTVHYNTKLTQVQCAVLDHCFIQISFIVHFFQKQTVMQTKNVQRCYPLYGSCNKIKAWVGHQFGVILVKTCTVSKYDLTASVTDNPGSGKVATSSSVSSRAS